MRAGCECAGGAWGTWESRGPGQLGIKPRLRGEGEGRGKGTALVRSACMGIK